jgi:excisionase family DNA binding protein
MDMGSLEGLLTSEDVANILKVDVVTVRRLVNRGELAAYRVGGEYRFKIRDINDYLNRQYVPAQIFTAGELDRQAQQAFNKFTRRAKQAMLLAAEEASSFRRTQIEPEHVLLGLIREGEGVAGRVLSSLGVQLEQAHQALESLFGLGEGSDQPAPEPSDETRRVIKLAVDEAKQLEHHYIGTEHLLLALMRDADGSAAQVLAQLNIPADQVRDEVMRVLKEGPRQAGRQ